MAMVATKSKDAMKATFMCINREKPADYETTGGGTITAPQFLQVRKFFEP